ncbi:MAG TPA: nuclear transport factor 2 family protein [Acidimicrobiales bacterium]|nr:nuclear transport factor 2 family protein [Acidimicrobiales bacterium]
MSRVADELEIRNLLARLAQLADSGDTEAYLELLSDDVVWVMPPNPSIGLAGSERRGHGEIATGQRERVAGGHQGPGSNTMHTVSTVSVRFDDDGSASAQSSFLYWADTATAPVVRSIGRYADTLRREAGRWRLARRVITFG